MRVVDIINRAHPAKVEAEYRRAYSAEVEEHGPKTWATAEGFLRYRGIVNDAVGIHTPMAVVIQCKCEDGQDWYDVSGRQTDDDASYALEFTPWGEWKLMEVEYPAELDLHQVACHLYYEMTWCGWPEQIIERLDHILDLKEELDRS